MKGEIIIRQAGAGNLLEIKSLLQKARLPTAGLESHIEHRFVLESNRQVLGAVGFEAYPYHWESYHYAVI